MGFGDENFLGCARRTMIWELLPRRSHSPSGALAKAKREMPIFVCGNESLNEILPPMISSFSCGFIVHFFVLGKRINDTVNYFGFFFELCPIDVHYSNLKLCQLWFLHESFVA